MARGGNAEYRAPLMCIPLYQIDAFADRPFTGNPAAVFPLEAWLPDDVMQAIAAEKRATA